MQNRPFQAANPQRPSAILPPLSKYYYGPAVSPDRTPTELTGTSWNTQNAQQDSTPPTLPPRPIHDPASAPPFTQTSSQHVKLPGPPPTAPPAHPVAQSSYNPNNYGPMPGARHSPVNATWNQSSQSVHQPDTSTWGVKYHQSNPQQSLPGLKPPLPPRISSSHSQRSSPVHENDVQPPQRSSPFEYLRPVAYSPASSPAIPQGFSPSDHPLQYPSAKPEPERLPPPPPKIPARSESSPDQDSEIHSDRPSGPARQPSPERGFWTSEKNQSRRDNDQREPHAEAAVKQSDHDQADDASLRPLGDNVEDHSSTVHLHDHTYRQVDVPNNRQLLPGGNTSALGITTAGGRIPEGSRVVNQSPQNVQINDSLSSDKLKHDGDSEPTHQQRDAHEALAASARYETTTHGTESEQQAVAGNDTQVQRDDSFYWHSPHSSASAPHDHDQNQDVPNTSSFLDATPEPEEPNGSALSNDEQRFENSESSTDRYIPALGPYSASALGFGGPSDWEHFGDYDGEEVDDTDLYIRPRSPLKGGSPTHTSELPAEPDRGENSSSNFTSISDNLAQTPSQAQQEQLHSLSSSEEQVSSNAHEGGESPSTKQKNPDIEGVEQSNQWKLPEPLIIQENPTSEQRAKQEADRTLGPSDNSSEPRERHAGHPEDPITETIVADSRIQDDAGLDHQSSLNTRVHTISTTLPNSLPKNLADKEDEVSVEKTKPLLDTQADTGHQQRSQGPPNAAIEQQDQSNTDIVGSHTDPREFSRENSIKRASLVSDQSVLSRAREAADPYANLDPWGRASLNRYLAMLHDEARASTDTERLNIFKAFSRKEWKLRAVLYGADDEEGEPLHSEDKERLVRQTSTLAFRRPASKALPALPPDADASTAELARKEPPNSSKLHKASLARLTMTEENSHCSSVEQNSVMPEKTARQEQQSLEEEASESYSPGGRPIQIQIRGSRKLSMPQQLSGTKLANTPFRYSQGYIDETDQPVDRRASFRPYAALKIESLEDRAENAPEPVAEDTHPRSPSQEPDDRQLSESSVAEGKVPSPLQLRSDIQQQRSFAIDQGKPLDLRRFERADFDPLIAVLPRLGQIPSSADELADLQRGMNAVPDDFGFIHQHVVAWDTRAKNIRSQHEKERQSRQGESEQRIDALFNDDEIGYGDIAELESEFKRAEATRKTNEDRAEYQTFVEEVFNAVWTRLHFEIDQLSPLYDEYTGLAHETLAGRDMFEAVEGQYALAPIMNALLTLHQRLEIRHQKAFEAVLERDRRLKKTEVAPWYTLGNVGKVKQLEKQFEGAERRAIVEYCKQRDARANRLMDVLDQNTLRGVGANQDYMEAIMKAVRRIASGRAFSSAPASESGLGMEEVVKAKTVTAVLASSSEQIVQTFHVADMLLNAAAYELSVATAKLGNAETSTFERLKEERTQEDAKLMRDLQHRLALIREDSRRTNDEIIKLLCFLGVQGGHAQAGNLPNTISAADTEHEQRLQKALEDAKKRNAQKAAADGGS
ncbi:MAG: hypothetical protein Q9222_001790 [Ikaeria aurantiellina]